VKTPPDTVALEMFTAPVPVLLMVTLCVDVLPTATFPNATLAGDAASVPPPESPTPLPLLSEAFVVYPAQPERLIDASASKNPSNE
jgi:hypothetical protein